MSQQNGIATLVPRWVVKIAGVAVLALGAQRFLSVFESVIAAFRTRRHLLSATRHRLRLSQAFHLWHKTAYSIVLP